MADGYLYYRIFNDNGALDVKDQFDTTDATLGRIHPNHITPPRTLVNLKRTISGREGIPVTTAMSLFLSLNDSAAQDDELELKNFFSERKFGINPEDPIGFVFQGNSDPRGVTPASEDVDLTGHWSLDETTQGVSFQGVLSIIMKSATTFDGLGHKYPVERPGTIYPFKMETGRVADRNQIEWTNLGAGGAWGDSSRSSLLTVSLGADGKTMFGSVDLIAGNAGGPARTHTFTFRRL